MSKSNRTASGNKSTGAELAGLLDSTWTPTKKHLSNLQPTPASVQHLPQNAPAPMKPDPGQYCTLRSETALPSESCHAKYRQFQPQVQIIPITLIAPARFRPTNDHSLAQTQPKPLNPAIHYRYSIHTNSIAHHAQSSVCPTRRSS